MRMGHVGRLLAVGFIGALAGCGSESESTFCGDGWCEGDERADWCPEDCTSAPFCGDGFCNGGESSATCLTDCPTMAVCGDGACSGGENASSCPGDCGSAATCGDGFCNGNETSMSCARDCGAGNACGDGSCSGAETCSSCPGDCGACCVTSPDSCMGENACIGGECISAFGRTYRVTVVDATLTTTDTANEPWDSLGGLPDPMVVVTLGGSTVVSTRAIQDTVSPSWQQSGTVVIPAGANFTIDVWDEDVADDDFMFGCGPQPLTADFLRGGALVCRGGGALTGSQVRIEIRRQ